MKVIYKDNYFKIALSTIEMSFKNTNTLLFDNFLQDYSIKGDGFYYPNKIKELGFTQKNDTYYNLVAKITTCDNPLIKNNWFINLKGELIDLGSLVANSYNVIRSYNSYIFSISESDEFNENSLPRTGTFLLNDSGKIYFKIKNEYNMDIDITTSPIKFTINGLLDDNEFQEL